MRCVRNIALILSILPAMLGAAVYRWVDENGVVNYTQLKPEGVDAELVSADTGQRVVTPPPAQSQAPATDDVTGTDGKPLNARQQKLLADLQAAEQARQAEIARVRAANCQEARGVLQRLTSRGRIRVVGDDGQERVMPEDERQRRIDEAQRAVAENCASTASR